MSDPARQLIAEDKRTRATFLDLNSFGLTDVPAEVADVVCLESITFSDEWWEFQGRHWRPRLTRNAGSVPRNRTHPSWAATVSGCEMARRAAQREAKRGRSEADTPTEPGGLLLGP